MSESSTPAEPASDDPGRTSRAGAVRAAIIGGGMIAAVHRRAVLAAGGRLVGALGSSAARSAELAEAWGVRAFPDIGSLLTSEEVDVVHVCSPNGTHAEYALAALHAGKHVVCEKPIATSASDARRIVDAARSTGLVAAVPFVYRFHPIVRELRARRLRGDFGSVYSVHGHYLQDWMLSPAAGNWRVDGTAGGASRAFADIGSHWCDLVEFVSGEKFESLTASTMIAVAERPAPSAESFTVASADAPTRPVTTEDTAAVILRTARGVVGNVVVSQVAAGRRNRLWFEMDGAAGSVVFDQENPETAWLGASDQATVIARGTGTASPDASRLSYVPGGHPQGYQDCFTAFVADTYAAIRGDAPDGLPTVVDGLRSAEIVEAVLTSAASGRWTGIGDAAHPA